MSPATWYSRVTTDSLMPLLSPAIILTVLALITAGCRPTTTEESRLSTATNQIATAEISTLTPTAITPRPLETTAAPPVPTPESTVISPTSTYFAFTYQRPDGNRLVHGRGALPTVRPVDIALDGQPVWLVATRMAAGSVWVAILADGRAQAFHVTGERVNPIAVTPSRLSPGTPPLLQVSDGVPSLIAFPSDLESSLTHPAVLAPSGEQLALFETGGDLVIWDGSEVARATVNGLVDARMLVDTPMLVDAPTLVDTPTLVDKFARLLLLTDATTRYNHGVLGDGLEATGITLVETSPTPRITQKVVLAAPRVFEGIAPIWADLTGDGEREIIVTLSDAEQGAQIVVYDEAGQQLAAGVAIGRGYRWRHQLAVAPFGPNHELELAVVRTPHIGGTVEFYRLVEDRLEIVAQMPGYTSHVIGSRNLDMAVAGDLDGDGRTELLLPDQARTGLGAIQHTAGGARTIWTLLVGGIVSTNLATVALSDETLAVGVGHDGNGLRLWLP